MQEKSASVGALSDAFGARATSPSDQSGLRPWSQRERRGRFSTAFLAAATPARAPTSSECVRSRRRARCRSIRGLSNGCRDLDSARRRVSAAFRRLDSARRPVSAAFRTLDSARQAVSAAFRGLGNVRRPVSAAFPWARQRSPPGSAALATSPPACRGLSRAPHGFSTLRCGLGGVRRAVRRLVSATRSGAAPPAVVDESRGASVDAVGG